MTLMSMIFRLFVDKSVLFTDVRSYLIGTMPSGFMLHVTDSFQCSFVRWLVYGRPSVFHYGYHSYLLYKKLMWLLFFLVIEYAIPRPLQMDSIVHVSFSLSFTLCIDPLHISIHCLMHYGRASVTVSFSMLSFMALTIFLR